MNPLLAIHAGLAMMHRPDLHVEYKVTLANNMLASAQAARPGLPLGMLANVQLALAGAAAHHPDRFTEQARQGVHSDCALSSLDTSRLAVKRLPSRS